MRKTQIYCILFRLKRKKQQHKPIWHTCRKKIAKLNSKKKKWEKKKTFSDSLQCVVAQSENRCVVCERVYRIYWNQIKKDEKKFSIEHQQEFRKAYCRKTEKQVWNGTCVRFRDDRLTHGKSSFGFHTHTHTNTRTNILVSAERCWWMYLL